MICPATRTVRTNTHRCLLPPTHDREHECACGHREAWAIECRIRWRVRHGWANPYEDIGAA